MSRVRSVVFTSFNYAGILFDGSWIKYIIWQIEAAPTTGKLHAQGYLELVNPMSFSAIKKRLGDPQAHLEARKGTPQEAADYCSKEETRVEGPFEYGEISKQGKRSDLESVVAMVEEKTPLSEIAASAPHQFIKFHKGIIALRHALDEPKPRKKPEIYFIFGEPGTGKSRWAFENYPNAFRASDNSYGWFDGYDQHETVIFDDFYGQFPLQLMLNLLDYYPLRLPIKGGYVTVHAHRFIFTSNNPPEQMYIRSEAFMRRVSEFGVWVSRVGSVLPPPTSV